MPLYAKIALFGVFLAAVIFVTIKYTPLIMNMIRNPEEFRILLLSYGSMSVFVYILFQIVHVVIVVIPGEVIQIAGGYIFGTVIGTVYSTIGIVLGMAIVFFATRIFGYSLIRSIVPQKNFEKFSFLVNNEKSEITMFVLFLIPGLPKDALTYIAGVTPIKPLRFLVIAGIARLPGLIGSSLIGSNLQQENYLIVILISIIALALFIVGILMRDKIINRIHSLKKKQKPVE